MTDIDPTTNLPQLPEDHFWRVTEGPLGIYPFVELRKRMPLGFSRAVEALWTGQEFSSIEDEIFYLCTSIISILKSRKKTLETMKRVTGDYPPKKLEA